MDELRQRELEMRERVAAINAGRSPVFGDRMRNLWAGEKNPQRDAIYVRTIRRTGRCNPGTWLQMTDGKGGFWEQDSRGTVFIDHIEDSATGGGGEG